MRRARAAAAVFALALAAAAAPASAYVRTSDPDTGVEIAWPLPALPFSLSSAAFFAAPSCLPTAAANPVEDVVRASFAAWRPACADGTSPNLQLLYTGRIPEIRTGLHGSGENLVVIRKGWCSTQLPSNEPCMTDPDVDCGGIYDCYEDHGPADRATVALTTVLYDPRTGRVFDADMEVNGWDGQAAGTPLATQQASAPHGYYFSCDTQAGRATCTTYGQAGCNAFDLANTVTHEAGPFIGLAHPCGDPGTPACDTPLPPWESVPYAQRTMYPQTSIAETSKRVLSSDDVAGICAIYPPAPGGCGSAGGAPGALAIALAALALRRRVRR